MSVRPLHFNAFIWPNGYHETAWRVVEDDVRGVLGLSYYAGRVAPSSCSRPPGRGPPMSQRPETGQGRRLKWTGVPARPDLRTP